MKKIIPFIAGLLFTSCAWFQPGFKSGLEGQKLPDFLVTREDNRTIFHTDSIYLGKSFILLLYRPDCPFCNGLIQDILNNSNTFSRTPIYLLTSYPDKDINQFVARFHLEKYPNIIPLRDSASVVFSYFKPIGVPYLVFYDKQKVLKSVFPGKTEIGILKTNLPD